MARRLSARPAQASLVLVIAAAHRYRVSGALFSNLMKLEFKAPAGLAPEGSEEGTEFEEVATFRVKKNGMICLVAIGDHQLPSYDKSEHEYGEAAGRKYNEAMEG